MSTNRFVGLAYWNVDTQVSDWLVNAVKVLMPVERAGLATIGYECLPSGDQMTVTFRDETHNMLVANGKGRGTVRASESATMFVVCLVALRKALGDLTVVTDSQEAVPTLPRQNYPLYADTWQRVLPVAQELELATGAAFVARHTAVLNNMF